MFTSHTAITALLAAAAAVALTAAPPIAPIPPANPLIERGYHQMYDLEFDQAHKTFADWEREHPNDPLPHVSNAAAYLFAEFDRLHILQSELFVEDSLFRRRPKVVPDPEARRAFNDELAKGEQLADGVLSQSPRQPDALFAKTLGFGLQSDYLALIDRRNLDSLRVIKNSRTLAEQLLSIAPSYYDAHLAIGVENYLVSLKPAPVRWILELGGAQADRERGLQDLRLTADKGHYLSPYARLLLAVAALRDKDRSRAREILADLAREFPHNRLYAEELARLR